MKTLLPLAISIAIFCDPLYTNGSPLQTDFDGIQSASNYSYTTAPAKMDYQVIESSLGISPNKGGLFRIDDVFFTAEEIKKNFGVGLGDKNGQPDDTKRWPKGKNYPLEECQTIEIFMSGAAEDSKGSVKGTYSKSAKENGKLSWTSTSNALWFSTNGLWIVGPKESIGGNSGYVFAQLGLPYSSLINQWEYHDGNEWVQPMNEISVQCTNLGTVGKVSCGQHQEDSCADCPQGNGESWCNGDCKWVNGNCLSKVNGAMPITFHSSVTSAEKTNIKAQMDKFNEEMAGCLQFVDWTTESDYVEVNSHPKNVDPNGGGGCYSEGLGRNGNGKQVINLERGGCMSTGTIIHEFIHAWGFWHEQTRPDRDNFVKIIWDNIQEGQESQFKRRDNSYTFGVPYDGKSVMHYRDTAFGIKECQTIKITLSGGALAAQKSREGVYVKSAKFNGKLYWTKGNVFLWWNSNGYWGVGTSAGIGLYSPTSAQPYGNTNDWFYSNGNAWVNPTSEITVECTSLEEKTTIEPLPSYNFDPSGFGQRDWMTTNDAIKLKRMYMCEEIKPSGCGFPQWATDAFCDNENNNSGCNWDGGACCSPHEISNWDKYCKPDCKCLGSFKEGPTATTSAPCEDIWLAKKCQKMKKKGKCGKPKVDKKCKKTCEIC